MCPKGDHYIQVPHTITLCFPREDTVLDSYILLLLEQVGKHKEAAKASATFSYHNPHNTHIKSNVKYYKSLKDVTDEDLKPEDSLDYVSVSNTEISLFQPPEMRTPLYTVEPTP